MATGAQTWSTSAGSNSASDASVNWAEGMLPSAINNSARAEMASMAMWIGDNSGTLVTSGSSSAFTVTSKQVSTAPVDGYTIAVRFHAANAASATLNVDGIGAKTLQSVAGTDFSGGEFSAGSIGKFTYVSSSTGWVLNGAATPSNLHLTGTLTVDGAATFSSSMTVAKAALFSTGITVTNATNLSSNVTIGGSATLSSSLEVSGATHFSSNVTIDGTLTQPSASHPNFSASASTAQDLTNGSYVKIPLKTEQFDNGSYFDNATNYRYTPLVAGKYIFTGRSDFTASASNASVSAGISIVKNGATFYDGIFTNAITLVSEGSVILDMNGTTDYVELHATSQVSTVTWQTGSGATRVYLHGMYLGT